jgi:hypothetical protein
MCIRLLPVLLQVTWNTFSPEILTLAADFPIIPLGHINLLQEVGLHSGANVGQRKNGGNSVRRMYTARVHGCKSNMTVALYQGNGAEDVGFLFSRANPIFIGPYRDGGSTSHDTQPFGETIRATILIK